MAPSEVDAKPKAGLEDVVAGESAICYLDGDPGALLYTYAFYRLKDGGYDLCVMNRRQVQAIRDRSQAFRRMLVEAGYATRQAVEQSDRPDKHVYRVTDAGREAIEAWLEAPLEDREPFLLRVYLGRLGSSDALARTVRAQREDAEALRTDLEEIDARATGGASDYHASLTRRYGLAYAAAVIEWADSVERELGA